MKFLPFLKSVHENTYSRIFLLLFTCTIAVLTYIPGTRLMGWDNLQTDLNPSLGVIRAWWSVWEEYQSFGLLAGMAHAADLPRAILVFLMSFVFPSDMIRYLVQFGLVALGALGTYQLLTVINKRYEGGYGVVGSLFYIFNFMIIQLMYVPVEPFTYFLGFLPWLMWSLMQFLRAEKISKNLLFLTLGIFVVSLPFAVAQQLFIVLCLLIAIVSVGIAFERKSQGILKRGIVFGLLLLSVHAVWILPQIYFLKTSSGVVQTAKINQLSTQDIYYRNLDKGNLKDFLTYDGFFAESLDSHGTFLFSTWRNYRSLLIVQLGEIACVGLVLLGLLRQKRYGVALAGWYLLMGAMLLSDTPVFSQINTVIRSIPFINQIFRSPFTKFAIPYALISAVYFTGGIYTIGSLMRKKIKAGHLIGISIGLFVVLLVSLPIFKGEYISFQMKIRLPDAYKSLFTFFAQKDISSRIGLLPEYTHWGWQYNTWGYNGSGFLWYGIQQPIISRNFDMWSEKGESYYWEVKQALDTDNIDTLNAVLEKYDVNYLVLDESVVPLVSSTKAISYPRLKNLLAKDTQIEKVATYNFISVYAYSSQKSRESYVWGRSTSLLNIGPKVPVMEHDSAYLTYGDYQTSSRASYDAWYPFLDLTSKTTRTDLGWNIQEQNGQFTFSAKGVPDETTLPSSSSAQLSDLYLQDQGVSYILPYNTTINSGQVLVSVPAVQLATYDVTQAQVVPCSSEGSVDFTRIPQGLRIVAKNGGYGCLSFIQSSLDQQHSYVVKVSSKKIAGQGLYFYVLDATREQTYLEDRLNSDTQYYIINPGRTAGIGYSFSFQATSYHTIPSENILSEVSIYLLPDSLQNMSYTSSGASPEQVTVVPQNVQKDTYYRYLITMPTQTKTIVLDQMYHDGWNLYHVKDFSLLSKLFPWMSGEKVTSHVVVNNWENGWDVASGGTYIALFWPQYLEYTGIVLGSIVSLLSGVGVWYFSKKHPQSVE